MQQLRVFTVLFSHFWNTEKPFTVVGLLGKVRLFPKRGFSGLILIVLLKIM